MDRKKIIVKNVSFGLVFKVLNMGIVYLTIPFLLKFLGKESYGVWVTVFSVVNVLFFIDGGITNGLKTKLTEALSINDKRLAKEYISTAYIVIFSIAILLLLFGVLLFQNINFTSLLGIKNGIEENELKNVFLITLVFIISNFVLSLYKTLFYATQKSANVELSLLIYQFSIFCFIYYAANNLSSSLIYISFVYGATNLIISIWFSLLFFKKNIKLTPSINFFKKERIKDLMGLSVGFFLIQLSMLVIFTTDNLLISNLLGPEEVTNYSIVLKLFQVLIMFFLIILDSFWPLFTDAYHKKDYSWIRNAIKKLNKLFLLLIICIVILTFISKKIIYFWIGDTIYIENMLIYSMAIFVLIRVYTAIYMYFLNGIGKIKLQMWLYVFGAIINIPLSIFLVKYFNLGSSGVIIGTILSILSMAILLPLQSFIILKGMKESKI